MHFYKSLILALLLLGCNMATKANPRGIPAKVYMFGFAASFNDSTVYFTDIQEVDAFLVNNRTRFLINRDDYSYQLRDYLKLANLEATPTCVTFYAQTRRELMRKYQRMQKRYVNNPKRKFQVKTLPESAFRYQTVAPD